MTDERYRIEKTIGRGGGRQPLRRAPLFALIAIMGMAVVFGVLRLDGGDAALPDDVNLAMVAPTFLSATSKASTDEDYFFLGATEILHQLLRQHTARAGFQMASFRETYDEDITSAGDARQILGANVVLFPSFTLDADAFAADLQLQEAPNGRILRQRHLEFASTDPHGFLQELYRVAAVMLDLPAVDANAREALGVRGAGTLQFYLQGLGRLRAAQEPEDLQFAIDDFELGCRTEPESGVMRAGLATAQRRQYLETRDKQWLTRAEASAREAVALADRAETQSILAFTLSSLKDRPKAAAAFEQAHAFDPTDNNVNLLLGRNYGRMGQAERERQVYAAAIEARPHCWQPYWWLATWHYRQGNVAAAIASYRDMIERSPNLYKGYTSLGGLLVLDGAYKEAIEALEHSVQLRPTRSAFSNLGTAYFNLRDFASSVDAYNQAFQFGFADYALWLNLGDAYRWLKDRADQANEAYEQAVRLAREEREQRAQEGRSYDVMIAAHLSAIFPKLGLADSARAYLAEALEADGDNPMVQYNAALAFWQLEEPEIALDWLEKSVAGGYPTVWLRDSAVFDDWRASQRFRGIVGEGEMDTQQQSSKDKGD